MAPYQMLVAGLDGATLCLKFSSDTITGADVGARVSALNGIPLECQRLVTGSRGVGEDTCLAAGPDGVFPSCTVLLRLRGGKGGFGSLLRGAATKAGQKKTSNFDACRDMSGRRLRHVNAEKKLKEWKGEAEERELEKTAEEFLKKDAKAKEENSGIMKDLERFREETSRAMEDVGLAVESGLAAALKLGVDVKRKKIEAVEIQAKRSRIWLMEEEEEMDEQEDVDEGLDTRGGADGEQNGDLTTSTPEKEEPAVESGSPSTSNDEDSKETLSDCSNMQPSLPMAKTGKKGVETGRTAIDGNGEINKSDSAGGASSSMRPSIMEETRESEKASGDGPVNFDDFQSAKEMEVLGLEKLKVELQAKGLKCGGSLSERAARLFLLKTTPLEKLDKKLFTAKSKGAKI